VRASPDRSKLKRTMKRHTALFWALLFAPLLFVRPGDAVAQEALPKDVHADSRSRLPLSKPDAPQGAAGIRLHGSGVVVRWESPLGRALTELAILTSAREHDQPYEWSLHELEGIAVGLNPAVIDVVRNRKSLAGVPEKESMVVQLGREIFGRHKLSSETYARALKLFGEKNLVDILSLMADYAGTATRLTAVNQQMPPGWKQFLPLPFTPPEDIQPDSRSRLPLKRNLPANAAAAPALYSRNIAPEGTGPGQIRSHGAGIKSLEGSVGRRLMGLAILVSAREHDAQYDWTMNEVASLKDGLEPAVIDVVRLRKPVTGLGEKESVIIEFGRELFGKHVVTPQTYARALKAFGERDLVDLVDLMAQHATDAMLLTAFDQHLPVGQKPLLPIP
jgi:4-carboxymuconolactone decarboxylase